MPKILDVVPKRFECDQDDDFTIVGTGFSKHVIVDLAETRYLMDHEWKPPELECESDASSESATDGTHIQVSAKPRKKDGSPCGSGHPLGDLTITVTNQDSHGSATGNDTHPFDVIYYS